VAFELYTDAALARDIPEHRLRRGDVVKIVDVHASSNGENGIQSKFSMLSATQLSSPQVQNPLWKLYARTKSSASDRSLAKALGADGYPLTARRREPGYARRDIRMPPEQLSTLQSRVVRNRQLPILA
jgi:hypothetical protein